MKDDDNSTVTPGSPGGGVTIMPMSDEPLATEGEATPGPDDENPFEEILDQQQRELGERQARSEDFFRDQIDDEPKPGIEQDEIGDQVDFGSDEMFSLDLDLDLDPPEF